MPANLYSQVLQWSHSSHLTCHPSVSWRKTKRLVLPQPGLSFFIVEAHSILLSNSPVCPSPEDCQQLPPPCTPLQRQAKRSGCLQGTYHSRWNPKKWLLVYGPCSCFQGYQTLYFFLRLCISRHFPSLPS